MMVIVVGIGGVFLTLAIRSFSFGLQHIWDNLQGLCLVIVISIMPILLGSLGIFAFFYFKPIKFYNNGLVYGEFIPWEQIESAEIEDRSSEVYCRIILIKYTSDKTIILNNENISDPMRIMRILSAKIPSKLGPNIKMFVGLSDELRIVSKPYTENVSFQIPDGGVLFFALIMYCLFAFVQIINGYNLIRDIFLLFFSIVMSLLITLELAYSYRDNQIKLIRLESTINSDGIHLPHRGAFKLFRKVRRFIPYAEIEAIRTSVDPYYLAHELNVELNNKEKFRLKYSNVENVMEYSRFRQEDQDFVNPNPMPFIGHFSDWNYLGILLAFFLLFVPGVAIVVGL